MAKSKDSLSLSFLDVLSCSLGSMILLFLIFSTLSHQGDRSSQSHKGIDRPGTKMIPSRELGTEEKSLPVLIQIDLVGLDARPGTLSLVDNDLWAEITREPTLDGGPKSTWLIFIPDSRAASGKGIALEPADSQFRVEVKALTGFGSDKSESMIAAKGKANEPRLTFLNGNITVRTP